MNQKKFDNMMLAFLKSEAGSDVFGTIVKQAIGESLLREIRFEDGKSEPGRIVEKTETWNILDWLATYLPHIESSIRGCQSDAAQARNRAANTRDLLLGICRAASDQGLELLPEEKRPLKIGEGKNHA